MSASPRRQELLTKLGFPFDVAPSNAHERWVGDTVAEIAMLNAVRKVEGSVFYGNFERLLIGADTVIEFQNQVYGKPSGVTSAQRMLEMFSGNRHRVITGLCLATFTRAGKPEILIRDAAISEVEFHSLTKKDIRHYIVGDEWRGKAGAYAIQGNAGKFVKNVNGDYENVVGLPMTLLRERLGTDFSHCEFL